MKIFSTGYTLFETVLMTIAQTSLLLPATVEITLVETPLSCFFFYIYCHWRLQYTIYTAIGDYSTLFTLPLTIIHPLNCHWLQNTLYTATDYNTLFTLPLTTVHSLHCHWLQYTLYIATDYNSLCTLPLTTIHPLHCHWLQYTLYTATGTRILLPYTLSALWQERSKNTTSCYDKSPVPTILSTPKFKLSSFFLLSSSTLFTQFVVVHEVYQLHVCSPLRFNIQGK